MAMKMKDMKMRCKKQQAFTKVELLITLAVIALLCAILFPVVQSFKSKKLQASCASNERLLSSALSQYVQDNDQTYPWSYSTTEKAPNWNNLLLPYIKGAAEPNTAFVCPGANTPAVSYSANGQLICLLDLAHKSPSPGWYNSVTRASRVSNPQGTVLLADGLLSSFVDASLPISGHRSAGEFAYPHPADTKDHTEDKGWDMSWLGISNNNHQISWRHSGGSNVIFCDGHAKYAKPGDLKDVNWDIRCKYGKVCEGSPNSAIYAAPNGACGDQSPINCQ